VKTPITIIDTVSRSVEATPDADRNTFLIEAAQLPAALGWEIKPSGLCKDDTCVPLRDVDALWVDDRLDLRAVSAALGRPLVIDVEAGLMAVALPAELRRQALEELRPPTLSSPTSTESCTPSMSGLD
jgi:hypothetical protein